MKPKGETWGHYIYQGIGKRASRFGERVGIEWLIYNPMHFRHFHEFAVVNAPGVIGSLVEMFPHAQRYADIGAGSGAFAAEAKRLGKDVIACEHNRTGRKMAHRQHVNCVPFDLAQTPPAQIGSGYDLAYCFEVAEHLPPFLGDRLIDFLAALASTVAFSAATPGQGGTGHINEQPKEYWIERFEKHGMRRDGDQSSRAIELFNKKGVTAPWFADNIMIFHRVPR